VAVSRTSNSTSAIELKVWTEQFITCLFIDCLFKEWEFISSMDIKDKGVAVKVGAERRHPLIMGPACAQLDATHLMVVERTRSVPGRD
jgi:hypothetical protein